MKTTLALMLTLFSTQIFAADAIDCSRTKRTMETLCGDYIVDECNLISDCFKRRDSCGNGVPKSASDCTALNNCHQSLHSQYESHFSEPSACRYEWAEIEDDRSKSFCRVKGSWTLTESACPGNISLFNFIVTSIDSAVDEGFNCGHLKSRYAKKTQQCDKLRAEFKVNCQVQGSVDDQRAYDQAGYPACANFKNFDKLFRSRSMRLEVDRREVNQGRRGNRKSGVGESGSQQGDVPAVPIR